MNNHSHNNYANVNLKVCVNSDWQPVVSAQTKTIASAVDNKVFRSKMDKMLQIFDDQIPEQYDGFITPYMPLNKRRRAMDMAFDFGDLVIQTQAVGQLSSNEEVSQATLYILTSKGYEPLFSRYGTCVAQTDRVDGAIAGAETSAIRRIYCALGMGDPVDNEIDVVTTIEQRKKIEQYLSNKKMKFLALLQVYNATTDNPEIREEKLEKLSDKELMDLFNYTKSN